MPLCNVPVSIHQHRLDVHLAGAGRRCRVEIFLGNWPWCMKHARMKNCSAATTQSGTRRPWKISRSPAVPRASSHRSLRRNNCSGKRYWISRTSMLSRAPWSTPVVCRWPMTIPPRLVFLAVRAVLPTCRCYCHPGKWVGWWIYCGMPAGLLRSCSARVRSPVIPCSRSIIVAHLLPGNPAFRTWKGSWRRNWAAGKATWPCFGRMAIWPMEAGRSFRHVCDDRVVGVPVITGEGCACA